MTLKQKLAARYLAGGMASKDAAKLVGVSSSTFKIWMSSLRFKRYIMRVERRYLKTIDNELVTLKMTAFRVIREAMEQNRDLSHQQWGVNKVFQVSQFKETAAKDSRKTTEVNNYIGGEAFQTKEQKELSKALLRTYHEDKSLGIISSKEGQA